MEDIKEVRDTDIWTLYQHAVQHMTTFNMFTDSDRNYRMYNGDQWEGLNINGVEKVQQNFIKSIVDYKVSVLNQNLWNIVYSSDNFNNRDFKPVADKLCELLNKRAAQVWESSKMDDIVRKICLDACVNDEAVLYSNYENGNIENELLNKTDIYYGNENSSKIESQPYILIKKRMPVITAKEIAKAEGVPVNKLNYITSDSNNSQEEGEYKMYESTEMVTVITKLWKEKGIVHYSQGTQKVDFFKDRTAGLKRYPVAHMLWTDKKGYSRGEGVVRNLIPNQLEYNKTLLRRALVTKNTAYQQKVVKIDAIDNPEDIDKIGSTIEVHGTTEDVRNVFYTTQPAQMSGDVNLLQNDLIQVTRDLESASNISTGSINPEDASGKAILAVQNASRQTLTEQLSKLKNFLEDVALIWLDMIRTYSDEEIVLEAEEKDIMTGEIKTVPVKVPKVTLEKLEATVKIDITPMSSYDQYARELTLENLLKQGFLRPEMIQQLEVYAKVLPDNSVAPKQQILEMIELEKNKQQYINEKDAEVRQMLATSNQYLDRDPEVQSEIDQNIDLSKYSDEELENMIAQMKGE